MAISKSSVLISVLILALFVGGVLYFVKNKTDINDGVMCTMEAKLCPDGSYVGRSGPKCEFAQCPGVEITENWKTFSDTKRGISFRYPENIPATYIHTVDWPPHVEVSREKIVCTEAGEESTRAGKTTKQIINSREYCVTKITEGAAGSIYTQYAYATTLDNRSVYFTFSLRAVQCGNYDNPEKTNCENERKSFNIDFLLHRIVQTTYLTPEEITYFRASADMIIVGLPFPGAVVGKNFSVIGQARGGWFFEASFPLELRDKDGKVIATGFAQAEGEWMTNNFVPFKGEIKAPASYIGPATLVLMKDNASGLPEHDASISFPITVEY